MNVKSEKELLEEFVRDNTDLERLEEIVDEFNIFTALDIKSNEIRHSKFLSWLMNPGGSHGLGDYFLTSLLKEISSRASSLGIDGPSIFDIEIWDFDDAEVLTEWGNIDIVVRNDSHRLVCVIENKIDSAEHSQQLRRYKDRVNKEWPSHQKLFAYLTVEGDRPSENEYVPLSYSDIVSMVEHLLESKRHKLGPEILAFISHYKEMLRRYIVKDSEVQEICQKIYKAHKHALDRIFEYNGSSSPESGTADTVSYLVHV